MAIIIEGADGTQIKVAGRGKAGQSPYEAAVAGGYQGTEEEFNQILADAATKTELATKQDKLTGTQGQVVGFDDNGNAVAQAAPDTGVTSFKGRKGAVTPQNGDYTADMVGARPDTWTPSASDVGAVPTSRTVNGKSLNSNISLSASDVGAAPQYTYGTTDLTAGSSTLATGTLYFVYE